MGRGPPGDPVRLWCHLPSRAPQRFAANEDVVGQDLLLPLGSGTRRDGGR